MITNEHYQGGDMFILTYSKLFCHSTLKSSMQTFVNFQILLACVLLTTSQPFLGLMLFPNISATDILRDNEAKTRMLTLLVVADDRNCSILRY